MMPPLHPVQQAFAQLLRGEPTGLAAFGLAPDAFLRTCVDEDLAGLVYERLRRQRDTTGWPDGLRAALAEHLRAETAAELVRRAEVIRVLEALSANAVRPLLLKGTPLAYLLYNAPHLRPRCDVDLLIPRARLEAATATLRSLGYAAPPYCGGELLFGQVVFVRTDALGIDHVIDLHWKLSTQAVVADLLTYDDIAHLSVSVPALGPIARTAGLVHALLIASVHGVVHHRNIERLIWIHDIHLLASRLRPSDLEAFVDRAIGGRVAAVCAHSLRLSRARLGTIVPDKVLRSLEAAGLDEPSAAYLRPGRTWRHEQMSTLRSLAGWPDRLRLAREVLLPAPDYMRQRYGLVSGSVSTWLLPACYVYRTVRGGVDVLRGRK